MAHARTLHLDKTFTRPEFVGLLDGIVVADLNRGSRPGDNGGSLNLWDRHCKMEESQTQPCFIYPTLTLYGASRGADETVAGAVSASQQISIGSPRIVTAQRGLGPNLSRPDLPLVWWGR